MKWVRVIFIVYSIVLAVLYMLSIYNCMVSYTYEVQSPIGKEVRTSYVGGWILGEIELLVVFLVYVIISILLAANYRKNK